MKNILVLTFILIIFSAGCKSWNRSQKGAVIGTAGGAATGAVIGRAAGNTALGAIIGATVGGVAGAVIGHKMDKQAEEMKKDLPDAKVVRLEEGIVIEFNNKIFFGFNKSNLTTEAINNLNKLVPILIKYPDTNIEVQGHTDDIGSHNYNKSLSLKRSGAVTRFLKSKGIKSSRLTAVGFGESVPFYDNSTTQGQTENRRVEFLISANKKMKADAVREAEK